MSHDANDIPTDVLEQMHEERKQRARRRHWCEVCRGHTGPGSPCYDGPEPTEEDKSAPADDQ